MNIAVIMIVIGVVFFLILALFAIRLGMSETDKEQRPSELQPAIHTSGIYSIVRKSPRENIFSVKVSKKEIVQYLKEQTVDTTDRELSDEQKTALASEWEEAIEETISIVESGDQEGVEFYFFENRDDNKKCSNHFPESAYITREEIHNFPELLPPFHIGCSLRLKPNTTGANFSDTATISMLPLVKNGVLPLLPDWREIG